MHIYPWTFKENKFKNNTGFWSLEPVSVALVGDRITESLVVPVCLKTYSIILLFRGSSAAPDTNCAVRVVTDGEIFCKPGSSGHTCAAAAADQCSRAEEPHGPADVHSTSWYGQKPVQRIKMFSCSVSSPSVGCGRLQLLLIWESVCM